MSTARIIQCFIFILLLRLFLVFLYRVVLSYCYHNYIFCRQNRYELIPKLTWYTN